MTRTSTDWSGGDPADLTAWTLVRAYHLVARAFYGALTRYGLTPQQFGVLVQLAHRPETSQAALARDVLATPQALGVMVRHLAAIGLVDRRAPSGRGHPAELSISEGGLSMLDRVTPDVLSAVGHSNLGLDAEQDRQLNVLLNAVINTVQSR